MTTKYERTHRAIMQTALRLFSRQGYEATSVDEIARSVNISEMTFYRHFASKQDVLLSDPYDPLIADFIRRQPVHLSALQAATVGIGEAWQSLSPTTLNIEMKQRLQIIVTSPELRAAMVQTNYATEQAIADALIERGTAPMDARVIAAAVMAALTAALLEWSTTDEIDFAMAIQHALTVLGGRDV